jgi:hypothetical protein
VTSSVNAPPSPHSAASKKALGQRPRWRERSRLVRGWRLWVARRPRTFTDKVRYKMLRDRRPLLACFADKAAVRQYVAASIGAQFLPIAYAITAEPRDLLTLDLPDAYVVKPTHGSGAAVVVSEGAAPDTTLSVDPGSWEYRHVRPGALDRRHLAWLAEGWLAQLYGQGPNREWAYGQVPRQIIVEELLTGPGGGIPDDLKFFVFHGRCRYIEIDSGRFGRRTQDFFDPDWNHLPLSGGPPWADPVPPRPAMLATMIALAERLGSETDFVRVDLYDLGDRIVFGELTSYPAGGQSPFEPIRFDAEFGAHWCVPKRYR